MENRKNNKYLFLAIITLISIVAIMGGCSSSATTKPKTNTSKTPVDNSAAMAQYANAPAGAQPPNMLGSPNLTVTVEEFADYQCPTCATVHTKMKEINSLYSGRIKFIYRSFPLTQIHKNAYDAALAAEAAGSQGKYWAMQDQLFTNQKDWSNSGEVRKIFDEYAAKIGLDVAKFQTDMAGLPTKNRVNADLERGRVLGISGTPTIYINGNKLAFEQMMDVNQMRQFIDAELQKANTQPQTNPAANQAPANPAANPATNPAPANNATNQPANVSTVNK